MRGQCGHRSGRKIRGMHSYRMLSELSFGSAAEPASYPYNANNNTNFSTAYPNAVKMNLNYDNLTVTNGWHASATNFMPVAFH